MPPSSDPIKSFLISLMTFTALGFIVVGLALVGKDAHYGWSIAGGSSLVLAFAIVLLVSRHGKAKVARAQTTAANELSAAVPPSTLEGAVWSSDDEGLDLLRALLASDEHDVHQVTSEGNSLIAYAAEYAPADTVQCLLEAGADPNTSGSGELAAVAAVLSEDVLSLAWLLAYGADPLRNDADGDSAFSLALESDQAAEMLVLILLSLDACARAQCLLKIEAHDVILVRRVASGLALPSRFGAKETSSP